MSSSQGLSRKTLQGIYEKVLESLKTSGQFDEMRVSIIDLMWQDSSFQEVIEDFEVQCKQACKSFDLTRDRKTLRAMLDTRVGYMSHHLLKDRVEKSIRTRELELRAKISELARDYLMKEYLQSDEITNNHNESSSSNQMRNEEEQSFDNLSGDEMDMDIEEPLAPQYSPISDVGDDLPVNDVKEESPAAEIPVNNAQVEPRLEPEPESRVEIELEPRVKEEVEEETRRLNEIMEPALEDIPIPPEGDTPPTPVHDERPPPTPVLDEPPQEDEEELNNDELEALTLSSVSSVKTNELSDFEDSINLSEDEASVMATIMGQPKNSRMSIERVQNTINGLQTKPHVKSEPSEMPHELSTAHPPPCETSESDNCSENAATGRRAKRERKSNPRYSNEHYTS